MADAEDAVVSERKGSVALISFNHPERLNAWSKDIGARPVCDGCARPRPTTGARRRAHR